MSGKQSFECVFHPILYRFDYIYSDAKFFKDLIAEKQQVKSETSKTKNFDLIVNQTFWNDRKGFIQEMYLH